MTSPVPLNPDGTPKLGSTATPVAGGAYSLWDIPKELVSYLNATSAGKLWFDVGQRTRNVEQTGIPVQPGLVAAPPSQQPKVTYKKETDAYNIYSKPWQIMAQFQAMSYNDPQRYAMLQQALAAGPWGKVNINGVFDKSTEDALGQAMLQYVKLSMGTEAAPVWKDPKTGKKSGGLVAYLLNSAATAQAHGGAGTSIQQSTQPVVLTDPAAVRQAALQAAQEALGQSISGDQLDKFVQSFQSAQTTAQTQLGGTIKQPDLSSDAMAFVQKSNPDEFKANQRMSYLDQLVNLFGGNRPNQNPTPGV
jgi:hypothetical protein